MVSDREWRDDGDEYNVEDLAPCAVQVAGCRFDFWQMVYMEALRTALGAMSFEPVGLEPPDGIFEVEWAGRVADRAIREYDARDPFKVEEEPS